MNLEIGLKDVLEQISARLNHLESRLNHIDVRLDNKADKWEMRIWFMTIMVLLGPILGTIITRL